MESVRTKENRSMNPSGLRAGPHDRGDPDPYPSYAWFRSRTPIQRIADREQTSTWLVTGHREAFQLLADPRLSADLRHSPQKFDQVSRGERRVGRSLLSSDPPDHTRLRQLVAPAFSRQRVQRMRADITRVCAAAVDAFAGRGTADLLPEYALVIPVTVIHEVLGIPEWVRADSGRCLDLFLRAAFGSAPEREAHREVEDYLAHILDEKRHHRGDDVTSLLLDGLDSGTLRDEGELFGMLYVLLGAGHTTTVPFLATAILRLLELPAADQMVDDEGALRSFLEEVLRHDSPVQVSQVRHALADLEVAGARMAAGDTVLISFAAANRDPAWFADPDDVQPSRAAGKHLAFGHGAHFCLGVHLARLEAEIGLRLLFQALPTLRLSVPPSQVSWGFGPMLRGPRALPVSFPAQGPPATARRPEPTRQAGD